MVEDFDNAKPWPEEPGRHHNEPPLEARVVMDFEDVITRRGLAARATEIADAAERCPEIVNREVAGKAGDLVSAARACRAEIEAERETLNRPLLTAKAALKHRADMALEPMDNAVAALRARLDVFAASAAGPVHGDYGARVGGRTSWRFEIEDRDNLPPAIRWHPTVMAAIGKVIAAEVKAGARDIAGVRIWSERKASVR